MRKVGATRIYTSSAKFLRNHVVEIDGRNVIDIYPLTHESPMTEWQQGVIVVSDMPPAEVGNPANISDFFLHQTANGSPMHAWHISDVDYSTGAFDETPHILST